MSDAEPSCGDGFLECDRRAVRRRQPRRTGDGCDELCRIENGYVCPPEARATRSCAATASSKARHGRRRWAVPRCRPAPAAARALEQCDDGDTLPGDGCSESCTIESGYVCIGSPSAVHGPRPRVTCAATRCRSRPAATTSSASATTIPTRGAAIGCSRHDPDGSAARDLGHRAFNGQLVVTAAEWCDGGPSRTYPLSANQPFAITVDRSSVQQRVRQRGA